ncbi:MAG: hypothetical protein V1664_02360 [Candidatus Uhrbacteria bacterium]
MVNVLHIVSQLSNLLGAIIMGFSIGKDKNEWVEGEEFCKGKKVYAVLLHHPRFFTAGVLLLILGFAVDLGITIYLNYAK